jgi:hypothetical protein
MISKLYNVWSPHRENSSGSKLENFEVINLLGLPRKIILLHSLNSKQSAEPVTLFDFRILHCPWDNISSKEGKSKN